MRASQYDSALSDGSGSSWTTGLGFRVPSVCIQSTTLPALVPVEVWK